MATDESERLLKEIGIKLRTGKLDSTLLFLCSSLSFLFGLLQTIVDGVQAIAYFLPLLVFGWVLPFSLGYLKGALLDDSVIERVIGWIYLVFRNLMYLTNVVSYLIPSAFPEYTTVKALAFLLPFTGGLLSGRWLFKFVRKIFDICGKEVSEIELEVADSIGYSAVYFSLAGYFYVLDYSKMVTGDVVAILVPVLIVFAGFTDYATAVSYMKKSKNGYHMKRKTGKPRIARLGWILSALSVFCMVLALYILNYPPHSWVFIATVLLFLTGFILFKVFSPRTEIAFEKKNIKN